MKRTSLKFIASCVMAILGLSCSSPDLTNSGSDTLTALAQTSGQLASGTSFVLSGVSSSSRTSTDSSGSASGGGHHGPGKHHGPGGPGGPGNMLIGTNFIATDEQLLTIIEAESAGDMRGLRMHDQGGATITHYDASGNEVTLPQPAEGQRPEGCSFSGKQFPKMDSLLALIAKTVADFGTGVTSARGDLTVTRSGKIIIERSGTRNALTETVTFDGYQVNGNTIEGVKTRINNFDESTGTGSSTTSVTDGKITWSDGTVSTWTSNRQRNSSITFDDNHHPESGTITTEGSTVVKNSDDTVLFSNAITTPVVENIACGRERHGPVSGKVTTVYKSDNVEIDFGDGTCSNTTVTVTINGVVNTHTIGG